MKKIIICLTTLLFIALSACDTGKTCKEACEKDDDCASEYKCLNLSGYGEICAPAQCQSCFDKQAYCKWDESWDGETLTCEFTECS